MEDNRWCFAWFIKKSVGGSKSRQALAKGSKWTSTDTITISFLDGDESLKQKVKQYAREWTAPGMANLRFAFVEDTNDTMVRISFRFAGSWSLIGKDCLERKDLEIPTMNLAIKVDSPDELIRRKVLHEFGHVLGLLHEHQIPDNGIKWKREQVISDLSGPPNKWSVKEIEDNLLKPAQAAETNFIAFDPQSIMLYPILAKWTEDKFEVGWNTQLSQKDKAFVNAEYP